MPGNDKIIPSICRWRSLHLRPTLFVHIVDLCSVYTVQGRPPDWQDFVGILTLLVVNSTVSFIEENNAGNAAAALMARLAPKAKVRCVHKTALRGFNWCLYECNLALEFFFHKRMSFDSLPTLYRDWMANKIYEETITSVVNWWEAAGTVIPLEAEINKLSHLLHQVIYLSPKKPVDQIPS